MNPDNNNTVNLKELALQLKCPKGTNGLKVAESMTETNISMTLHAIFALQLQAYEIVLELGHADCPHFLQLMSQANHIKYHGLETSSLMVSEASRKTIMQVDVPKPVFKWYNGTDIPYKANYFNKLFTVNTIYFWDKPKLLLEEIYRVLKPQGIFVLVFASKEYMETLPFTRFEFNLYGIDEVEAMVTHVGFNIDSITEKKEMIRNKMQEFVERPYYIINMRRT